jgi:hypothetical protein
MTITLGWWLASLIITVLAVTYYVASELMTAGNDYGFSVVFLWIPGAAISLAAWLVWALLT